MSEQKRFVKYADRCGSWHTGSSTCAGCDPKCWLDDDPYARAETAKSDEKCFACDKALKSESPLLVDTRDGQKVFVGPDCYKKICLAGEKGYQPPLGGPPLYPIEQERKAKESSFDRGFKQGIAHRDQAVQELVLLLKNALPLLEFYNDQQTDDADMCTGFMRDVRQAIAKFEGVK